MQQRWVHSQTGSRRAVSVFIYFRSKGREKEDATAPPGRSTMGPLKKKARMKHLFMLEECRRQKMGSQLRGCPKQRPLTPCRSRGASPWQRPPQTPRRGPGAPRAGGETGPHAPENLPASLLSQPQGMGKGISVLVGSAWGHWRGKRAGLLSK